MASDFCSSLRPFSTCGYPAKNSVFGATDYWTGFFTGAPACTKDQLDLGITLNSKNLSMFGGSVSGGNCLKIDMWQLTMLGSLLIRISGQ